MTEATVLQNRVRAGGFIQSEANFARSRDEVTLDGSSGGGGFMVAGTVLGMITASGKYVPSPESASDGAQTAVAVLIYDADATNGDVIGSVISRDAEVRAEELTYDPSVSTLNEQKAKWTQLAAVGIIVRQMGGVQVSES
jgi:Bacteriophage lambda head decoration protein D